MIDDMERGASTLPLIEASCEMGAHDEEAIFETRLDVATS